ncbi:hypothetical protein ACE1CD_15405 [Aerosakkonema sp. BLCC-F183]|uniref:hypothetical protein n=1 Tax=Aerosakkonema sp. BLCC-F183 TaxID=3342834 RepID=UPI0035BB79DA
MLSYKQFWAELKQRFLSDNSELLYGEAEIFVSNLKHREAEKELAIIECYKLLMLPEIKNTQINQVMLFTKKGGWFIERIELNEFSDAECEKIELVPELLKLPELVLPQETKGFERKTQIPPTKIKLLDRAIPV